MLQASSFPQSYVYTPTSLSPSTVETRLRDAIRGKLAFDYPSEISTVALREWYAKVVIKHNTTSVLIGEPGKVTEILSPGDTALPVDGLSYPSLSFEEVSAFSLLISNGRLPGPITIANPPDLSLLPDRPNVERIARKDGSLVLL